MTATRTPAPSSLPITLLVLDIDGVLTDGSINLDDDGRETKRFCAADGVGLRTWQRLGYGVAVITGRGGSAVRHRLADLGVAEVVQASTDKAASLRSLAERTGVRPASMAYVGDDWPDRAPMRRVGYPIAVANAAEQVKAVARFVTAHRGGDGAVREAIEHLLDRMGRMGDALALYDAP
ncbi:MAG: KdsC family phosphatase [Phycisphaerales bacterium]